MDISPDDLNQEQKSSRISKFIRAFIALLTLLAFVSTIFRYYKTDTSIHIVKIRDHIDKSQIESVDISIISVESTKPRDEDATFYNAVLPFKVPIDGGTCTLVEINADGYHPWERLFCPAVNERIEIEIEMIPGNFPPIHQNEFEA